MQSAMEHLDKLLPEWSGYILRVYIASRVLSPLDPDLFSEVHSRLIVDLSASKGKALMTGSVGSYLLYHI